MFTVNPTRRGCAVLTALLLAATAAHAQAAAPASAWAGTWRSSDGALMAIVDRNGELDAWGTDLQSIYRVTCVVDAKDHTVAQCSGDGINHGSGNRFIYRNRLKRGGEGHVTENWEAQERGGKVDGQAVFKRDGAAAKR